MVNLVEVISIKIIDRNSTYQDNYEMALEYYEKALAIFEKKLGQAHPYTMGTKVAIDILKINLCK